LTVAAIASMFESAYVHLFTLKREHRPTAAKIAVLGTSVHRNIGKFRGGFAGDASSMQLQRCEMADRGEDNAGRLIQRARGGDPEALGHLLQMYRDYLSFMAESQMCRYSHHAVSASDVVQETFLRAHDNFYQFQGSTEAALTAWLRRILANSIVSLARRPLGLRRQSPAREQTLRDLLDSSSQAAAALFVASDSSPSARASRRERAVLFANAMQQLPGDYRQVILLRHMQGLPFAQVAQQMGRSLSSVEKLWVRALKCLRQLLQAALEDEEP
jgi:RNA polymerase sigma-70 factor, ECF subfamily